MGEVVGWVGEMVGGGMSGLGDDGMSEVVGWVRGGTGEAAGWSRWWDGRGGGMDVRGRMWVHMTVCRKWRVMCRGALNLSAAAGSGVM